MSTGHPDYQEYAQWIGPLVDSRADFPLGLGNYTVTATALGNYAALVIGVRVSVGHVHLFVKSYRSDLGPGVFALDQFEFTPVEPDILRIPILTDTIEVLFAGTSAGTTFSFGVWPSNAPVLGISPGEDDAPITGILAVAPMLWDGIAFQRERIAPLYGSIPPTATGPGIPVTLIAGAADVAHELVSAQLSLDVPGALTLYWAGTVALHGPYLQAGLPWTLPAMGWFYSGADVGDRLEVDASAAGNVSGWAGVTRTAPP